MSWEDSQRLAYGRFPIAGMARWSHDWLFPRWGPGFRYHLGTDMFAARGTPLRAPVDGLAQVGRNNLGGLTVKVFMPDGTFFYMAHLEEVADDYVGGVKFVQTGDIVGYVGNSGNAVTTPPHLHIGVYPRGGPAVDPKPIMDQFVAEAMARLPDLIAQASTGLAPSTVRAPVTASPLLGSALMRPLTDPHPARHPGAAVVYAAAQGPTVAAGGLVDFELRRTAAEVDWEARALLSGLVERVQTRSRELTVTVFGPG